MHIFLIIHCTFLLLLIAIRYVYVYWLFFASCPGSNLLLLLKLIHIVFLHFNKIAHFHLSKKNAEGTQVNYGSMIVIQVQYFLYYFHLISRAKGLNHLISLHLTILNLLIN